MLTKSQKLNKIINQVRIEGISAYRISKATKISEAGLGKILNKISKNPQERTVEALWNYLFKEEEEEEEDLKLMFMIKLYKEQKKTNELLSKLLKK